MNKPKTKKLFNKKKIKTKKRGVGQKYRLKTKKGGVNPMRSFKYCFST